MPNRMCVLKTYVENGRRRLDGSQVEEFFEIIAVIAILDRSLCSPTLLLVLSAFSDGVDCK
jgi:hypothetical protein